MINLQTLDIKSLMPDIVASDEDCINIAEVFVEQLREIQQKLYLLDPLSSLDDQPDDALTHLAWEFSMLGTGEGWEEAKVRQQKIDLIRSAILLHKRKGTRWAVERVLNILNFNATIKEWFEAGLDPYLFKIHLDLYGDVFTSEESETADMFINEYKNVRSHLDSFDITASVSGTVYEAATMQSSEIVSVHP